MASDTSTRTTSANTVIAATAATALATNTRPRSRLPRQQRRHAARRELGADERRAQRPADDGQRPAHPLEHALGGGCGGSEDRRRPRGPWSGSTALATSSEISSPRVDAVGLQAASRSAPLAPPGAPWPRRRAVGRPAPGASRSTRTRRAPPSAMPTTARTHGQPDQPARRDPPQLGDHQPDHRLRSASWSVRAKKASSRLVSTGRSSVG